MNSCIYKGQVRHRRYSTAYNHFRYKLFMMYLDLDELPELFKSYWLWSSKKFAPAWFKAEDHIPDSAGNLKSAIQNMVYKETGKTINGPIRLLTHLRYFGYIFNPLSVYYCFDAAGEHVECIVAEVSNTPWRERHYYVLDKNLNQDSKKKLHFKNLKEFHVSPFMKLEMEYVWRLTQPGENLLLHIENQKNNKKLFDATLKLQRHEINSWSLAKVLLNFPVITLEVMFLIYYQAARLWLKKVPYVPHPNTKQSLVK